MGLPSFSLLAQSVLSGVFIGALYGLLGLGLSLSWGLLRQINLAHFALAFLAAYLCYQLSAVAKVDPLLTLVLIVPAFFALGAAIRFVNYALYCAAVAAAVLIALDIPNPSNLTAEAERVLFTFIGIAVGLLVMLLANRLAQRAKPPARTASQPV